MRSPPRRNIVAGVEGPQPQDAAARAHPQAQCPGRTRHGCSGRGPAPGRGVLAAGLTLILHAQPSLDWISADTKGTVALRIPADDVAQDLLTLTGAACRLLGEPHRSGGGADRRRGRSQLAESWRCTSKAGSSVQGRRCAAVHHR